MGAARHERHSLLERKCRELGIPSLMTAHHAGRDWRIHVANATSCFGLRKACCPKSLSLCSLCNLLLQPTFTARQPAWLSQVFKQSVARFYG